MTFPDQFLTFDYDASMPMGAPPPHNNNNNNHDPMPTPTQLEADDGIDEVGLGLALPAQESLNHVGSGTQSTSEAIRPSSSNASASANIDPLSIDPTLNQASPWSTAAPSSHHNHHSHNNTSSHNNNMTNQNRPPFPHFMQLDSMNLVDVPSVSVSYHQNHAAAAAMLKNRRTPVSGTPRKFSIRKRRPSCRPRYRAAAARGR